jgi:hypothetical protein
VSAPVVVRIPNPGQTRRSAPTVHAIANRSNCGGYRIGAAISARSHSNLMKAIDEDAQPARPISRLNRSDAELLGFR